MGSRIEQRSLEFRIWNKFPAHEVTSSILGKPKMHFFPSFQRSLAPVCLALLLAACGGGGGGDTAADSNAIAGDAGAAPAASSTPVQESGAPAATGNTATDGFNWTNFRRQQLGLSMLSRNTLIDKTAQGHSDYQKTEQHHHA